MIKTLINIASTEDLPFMGHTSTITAPIGVYNISVSFIHKDLQ